MAGRYRPLSAPRRPNSSPPSPSLRLASPFPPAPLPLPNPLHRLAAGRGTKALLGRPPGAYKFRIASGTVAGAQKKFCRDDPRGGDGGRLEGGPCWAALPVAAALSLPLLLAVGGLAIAPPRLPLPPPARLLPARLTAIARPRLLGPEHVPTPFQQTDSTAGTTCPTRAPGNPGRGLILGRSWAILTRAHGRCLLPEAHASKGNTYSPPRHPPVSRGLPSPCYLTSKFDRVRESWVAKTERPRSSHSRVLLGVGHIH